jgi:hypothetical protein
LGIAAKVVDGNVGQYVEGDVGTTLVVVQLAAVATVNPVGNATDKDVSVAAVFGWKHTVPVVVLFVGPSVMLLSLTIVLDKTGVDARALSGAND